MNPRADHSPADHAIALLGSLGGAATMGTVAVATLITGATPIWTVLGLVSAVALAALAGWSWGLVRRLGFYHPAGHEDEDERPEGGTGVRFPPDAPLDGGSPEFDWAGFLDAFWEHVEATARERETAAV